MLNVDFGGAGKGGAFLTINLDGEGKGHSAPDIVADISAAANALGAHLKPQSVDFAQCIATLEHLPPWNLRDTLAYWRSFMKPGALLLVAVPDMPRLCREYADGLLADDVFMGMIYGPREWQWRTPWEGHRWGFSADSLIRLLCDAGYRDVRRADYPADAFVVDGHPAWVFALEAVA